MRRTIPLPRARSHFLPVRECSPAARLDPPRTATHSAHRRRAHQQRNCQSFLPLRTNREKPFVPHEAENRRRRTPRHSPGLPHPGLHGLALHSLPSPNHSCHAEAAHFAAEEFWLDLDAGTVIVIRTRTTHPAT